MASQAAAAAQLAVMRDEEALAALVRVAAEVTTDSPLPACLTEHSGALPLHCQVGGGGGVGGREVGCRGGRVAVGGSGGGGEVCTVALDTRIDNLEYWPSCATLPGDS